MAVFTVEDLMRKLSLALPVLFCFGLLAAPVKAAETVYIAYGPFEFSVAVDALAQFAQEGTIAPDLKFILGRFNPERQAQARQFLQLKNEVSPVILSRVGYSVTGERLIRRMGDLIQTRDGQNGFYGIRSALVQAAAEPGGLTLINFLRRFPTDIRLNVRGILQLAGQIKDTIRDTDQFVAELQQETVAAAKANPINVSQLADLRQPGTVPVEVQDWALRDPTRDRPIPVTLYRPVVSAHVPLIVISGGLGGERNHFQELARHLSSHGFAVVELDHLGSNDRRQKDFFRGLYSENFDSQDFVDRPLDVTFVLDELEKRNATEFNGQLNLKQVGMFGYSLGGTAALALAGAKIDFERLEKDCGSQINVVNIAVLYQCRALELPRQDYQLQDDRIQAVFLYVPSSRHIYGEKGIASVRIPIFWQATNEDIVTPLLLEQAPMFKALPSPEKYLLVAQRLPHTQVILRLLDRVTGTNRSASSEELFQVTQNYLKTFNTAFFKEYISREKQYQNYLTPAYVEAFAQKPYRLSLVRSLR
jgi:predicted dienelactone hydrolase